MKSEFEKAMLVYADKVYKDLEKERGHLHAIEVSDGVELGAFWAYEWMQKHHEPDELHSIKYSIVQGLREKIKNKDEIIKRLKEILIEINWKEEPDWHYLDQQLKDIEQMEKEDK